MNMSNAYGRTEGAIGAESQQSISETAMSELTNAQEICERLDSLLNRLRPPAPVGLEKASDPEQPTLQGTLRHLSRAHHRAHELLSEIERAI